MFRAANARGNDVVEASMSFSVLIEEVTDEGHHLRSVHELKLVRDRSPMFTLSWLVMHVIDDDSPLKNVDWNDPGDTALLFIVTMLGFDGTLGQQVHARHLYGPDDVRVNEQYEDVLNTLPDGRLLLDFEKFHDHQPADVTLLLDGDGKLIPNADSGDPEKDSPSAGGGPHDAESSQEISSDEEE
jgi:inward rectifier potassium channel